MGVYVTTVSSCRNESHYRVAKAYRVFNDRNSFMHVRRRLPDPVDRPEQWVLNILQARVLYFDQDMK